MFYSSSAARLRKMARVQLHHYGSNGGAFMSTFFVTCLFRRGTIRVVWYRK